MIITIVNRTKTLKDEQVLEAIRAINRQISEDFKPYWSFGATLRLEGAIGAKADKAKLTEMRGDAVLYLVEKADTQGALGYHDTNFRGIPYGFVFLELCKKLKENWTVTLSHEALELLGDAQGNLLVQGPHPANPDKEVFHWFEMCDAVQSLTYKIDGIEVSDFLLPLYFTPGEQEGGRNDFLSTKGLHSFGVHEGGYIGYYDPQTHTHATYFAPDDGKARQRSQIKNEHKAGRGYVRKRGNATAPREDAHSDVLKGLVGNATCPDPIKHIVVLMMENRSFDHMLGDATKIYPDLDGIPQHGQKYRNISTASGKVYEQTPTATETVSVDLPHEFDDVQKQLGDNSTHPMGGFVDAYLAVDGVKETNPGQVDQAMAYFPFGDTPAQDSLPALHALARNFLVCDRWFSSMPGPTWPNRFFIHSGTCLGHIHMPSRQQPEYMYLYDQDTLYDRLSDAGKKWRIYHQGVPQSIVMSHMWLQYGTSLLTDRYASIDDLEEDAKDESKFPDYVFIEPSYFGQTENDQHPPTGVAPGDQLIARVYNAIRSNEELWRSTLLIVTYDEHGGFFDHVPPPATVAPDGNTKEFAFSQLGVRVPTILVSPWVDKGVCKTQFDHTSVLRYVCDKWGMKPLSNRASSNSGAFQANSVLPELIKRASPRDDAPASISARSQPKGRAVAAAETPVEGAREALMYFLATLPEGEVPKLGLRAAHQDKASAVAKLDDKKLKELAENRFGNMISKDKTQQKKGRKK